MIQLRVVIFFSLWSKVRRCKSRVSNKEKYPPKKLVVFLLSFWRRTKDKSSRSVTLPATLPNLSLVYHLNSISTLQRIFIRPWFLFFFLLYFSQMKNSFRMSKWALHRRRCMKRACLLRLLTSFLFLILFPRRQKKKKTGRDGWPCRGQSNRYRTVADDISSWAITCGCRHDGEDDICWTN